MAKEQKPKPLDRTPKSYRVKSKTGEVTCAGIKFTTSFQEVQLDPYGSAFKSIDGHHQLVIETVADKAEPTPASSEKAAD